MIVGFEEHVGIFERVESVLLHVSPFISLDFLFCKLACFVAVKFVQSLSLELS